jgi:hypothetical protein
LASIVVTFMAFEERGGIRTKGIMIEREKGRGISHRRASIFPSSLFEGISKRDKGLNSCDIHGLRREIALIPRR